ncbi:MAG: hypothetical protein H0W96_08825, partial [Solirubrobacterales bacterium]|nr:hypothetical protein [Solirubrobacterales bacterium]
MSRTTRLLILAFAFGVLLVPSAQASPAQTSIMMDDDLLLYRNDDTAAKALVGMKKLGVDTVRVTVLWKVVAEHARPSKAEIAKLKGSAKENARKQARRFKAVNPSTYPRRNWDRFDNLVRSARNVGIKIYFNVTGPGPAWAHATPPAAPRSLRASWKPRHAAFKQFVTAVGRRFDGNYRDENGDRGVLPRVSFWSLWNEPNQAGWLAPQWENGVPAAPAIYRKLHQYGYRGLLASGHHTGNDIILMGETAPLGTDAKTAKAPMRPGLFLRELATGRGAAGDFAARGPLVANGFAHHPYTKNVPPTVLDPNPDSLTMANINKLGALLDDLSAKTGGAIPNGLNLFMTEFGFETNPPDPFAGVSLNDQAKFNTIGEFIAWSNPRIQAQAQFLYRDVDPVRKHPRTSKAFWFTYQSGLFFRNGTPKPALGAYQMPFLAFNSGTLDVTTGAPVYSLWGQLRLLPNGRQAAATIQWRARDGSTPWISVG